MPEKRPESGQPAERNRGGVQDVEVRRLGLNPIGIDQAAPDGDLPLTMQAYGFRGTPSLALIDRQGELRFDHLGRIDDLVLGGMLGRLLAEGTGG